MCFTAVDESVRGYSIMTLCAPFSWINYLRFEHFLSFISRSEGVPVRPSSPENDGLRCPAVVSGTRAVSAGPGERVTGWTSR
jgi:hypothetical protein